MESLEQLPDLLRWPLGSLALAFCVVLWLIRLDAFWARCTRTVLFAVLMAGWMESLGWVMDRVGNFVAPDGRLPGLVALLAWPVLEKTNRWRVVGLLAGLAFLGLLMGGTGPGEAPPAEVAGGIAMGLLGAAFCRGLDAILGLSEEWQPLAGLLLAAVAIPALLPLDVPHAQAVVIGFGGLPGFCGGWFLMNHLMPPLSDTPKSPLRLLLAVGFGSVLIHFGIGWVGPEEGMVHWLLEGLLCGFWVGGGAPLVVSRYLMRYGKRGLVPRTVA